MKVKEIKEDKKDKMQQKTYEGRKRHLSSPIFQKKINKIEKVASNLGRFGRNSKPPIQRAATIKRVGQIRN